MLPKLSEGRVEWGMRECQRMRSYVFVECSRTKCFARDCRAPRALVCSEHDAVHRASPRRPPLLEEHLQVHP